MVAPADVLARLAADLAEVLGDDLLSLALHGSWALDQRERGEFVLSPRSRPRTSQGVWYGAPRDAGRSAQRNELPETLSVPVGGDRAANPLLTRGNREAVQTEHGQGRGALRSRTPSAGTRRRRCPRLWLTQHRLNGLDIACPSTLTYIAPTRRKPARVTVELMTRHPRGMARSRRTVCFSEPPLPFPGGYEVEEMGACITPRTLAPTPPRARS
jgi:hypothetical protein